MNYMLKKEPSAGLEGPIWTGQSNQSHKESAFRAFDTESKGHIDAKDLLNSLRFTQVDEAEAQEFIK